MCIKVIGIDPAPSKKSTVFDGTVFLPLNANELKKYLDDLRKSEESVLICWDAPLTGPRNPDAKAEEIILKKDYSQRKIESFFRSPKNGMKTPKGISVMGYSGCPHWTITRGLLGLPRVGPYDTPVQNLPFQLLASEQDKKILLDDPRRKCVVEVHPAVALWLWLANKPDYHYKKDLSIIKDFYSSIKEKFTNFNLPENITNDDQLDALVAWLLGKLWVEHAQQNNNTVILLGNQATGAMLLPYSNGLGKNWIDFNNN